VHVRHKVNEGFRGIKDDVSGPNGWNVVIFTKTKSTKEEWVREVGKGEIG
jgi:hypothetical protein